MVAYPRKSHAPSPTDRLPGELTGSGCGRTPYGQAQTRPLADSPLEMPGSAPGDRPMVPRLPVLAHRARAETRRRPIAVAALATAKRCGSEPDTSEDQPPDSTETLTLARLLDQR